MDKQLIIIRGVSGAGKSSFAEYLCAVDPEAHYYEADGYMTENGEYKFDRNKLGHCHEMCQKGVEQCMRDSSGTIIVSNTSTTEKELKPYLKLAEEFNYKVVSLIVENRHGNKSIHNVSDDVLEKQANRFSIKLK